MSDTLREREEIQTAIDGRTLPDLVRSNAERFGDRPALSWREDGSGDGQRWRTLSWSEYRGELAAVALGLSDLGVRRDDVVALMGANRPEHILTDQAAVHLRATPATLYRTLAPDQIRYTADNCAAKVAVLENAEHMRRWVEVADELDALTAFVLMEDAGEFADRDDVVSWEDLLARGRELAAAEPDRFEELTDAVEPGDVCVLLYTSGTTDRPKGVQITHANVLFEAESIERRIDLSGEFTCVSYLPLAHIAERVASVNLPLKVAGHTNCCPEMSDIRDYLVAARPTLFAGVPRVWEKFRTAIRGRIEEQSTLRRRLAERALRIATAVVRLRDQGRRPSLALRAEHRLLDRLVLSKMRAGIGLDNCDYAVSAAAPLSREVAEFIAAMGLPLVKAYGLTETTGVATGNPPAELKLDTEGPPLPGVEVRLGEDGEVLVRAPINTTGYLGLPDETEQLVDDDGWLHTGDVGRLDEDNHLTIVDRKKELIITAGGQNISPTTIESNLKNHPLVGHAVAIGDRRPYVTALIVLDEDTAPEWAADRGLDLEGPAELAEHPEVRAEINAAVEDANRKLARVEQVKRWDILPVTWTPESDELTATFKLKRRVIHDRYGEQIEALYADSDAA